MPRIHDPQALRSGVECDLSPAAARHVQVLRLQPGAALTLFTGEGGEFDATVVRMGRADVRVRVGAHHATEREASVAVHLAVGMPAADRMDWLVEKATEMGAASIQPLLTRRAVLRLAGERAARRRAHWQAVAVAACEQCGRNRVPLIHPVHDLEDWLREPPGAQLRGVLSLDPGAPPLAQLAARRDGLQSGGSITLLSGPEGGLEPAEESLAQAAGYQPLGLGTRVLRAETAPLAALALLVLNE